MINIKPPHYTQTPLFTNYNIFYVILNFINMYRDGEAWEGFYYKVNEKLARRINTV